MNRRASKEAIFVVESADAPLAARMRPRDLSEFVGQEHILGEGRLLRRAIQADQLGSLIFSGPPGSGKTTLAQVIAQTTRAEFVTMNAVFAGVKDIRAAVEQARQHRAASAEVDADAASNDSGTRSVANKTILFVDEVHRFNKSQQDALLPHVENGTLTFIGATTENPYFEVIKALVSRSRVFELKPLTDEDVVKILSTAVDDVERGLGTQDIHLEDEAAEHLAKIAQGDARNALNALELAAKTTAPDDAGRVTIDLAVAAESIQRRALLYDKDGDAHYDTISAFIKSLRGSDPDAALYWMARMIQAGEDPRFVARRMVIFASEDVGLADPLALQVATAAAHAVEYVGLPECQFNLTQACLHLALAPKSNSTLGYFAALKHLSEGAPDAVPNHLKDPSRDKKGLGHGAGYKYPHAFREHWTTQQYLPDGMQGASFYTPGWLGFERQLAAAHRERAGRQERALLDFEHSRKERSRIDAFRTRLEDDYGERAVTLRDEVLRLVGLDRVKRALVVGRPRLLSQGILCEQPMVKICAAYSDEREARTELAELKKWSLDRLVHAWVASLGDLPVADALFEAAVIWRTIAQTASPAAFVAEIWRVLRPGGEVAIGERAEEKSDVENHLRRAGFAQIESSIKGGAVLVWAKKTESEAAGADLFERSIE